jgi:hypothetical protein
MSVVKDLIAVTYWANGSAAQTRERKTCNMNGLHERQINDAREERAIIRTTTVNSNTVFTKL